jgi:hypothetical protein
MTVPVYHFMVTGRKGTGPRGPSSYYYAKWSQGDHFGGVMELCFVLHLYNLCVSYLLTLLLTVSVPELVSKRVERSSTRLIGTVIKYLGAGELYMYLHVLYQVL